MGRCQETRYRGRLLLSGKSKRRVVADPAFSLQSKYQTTFAKVPGRSGRDDTHDKRQKVRSDRASSAEP
jgi:hypothetical protein